MDVGELAPEFTLPDEEGVPRRLGGFLAHGPVVLFFYPAALTTGCTIESCRFRDLAADFAEYGVHRVGVSPDRVGSQWQFATVNDLGFPLLSDRDRRVAAAYGVRRRGPLPNRRHTFVIGTDRRVLGVIRSEVRMRVHAERALRTVRARTAG